jgi:hypothetical protein
VSIDSTIKLFDPDFKVSTLQVYFLDVPVIVFVLAIEPNEEGFKMLQSEHLTEVSISRSN